MLTKQQQFKILQTTSGHFLCEDIPDNWDDLEETERDEFLTCNAWQPLENMGASEVWEIIDSAAIINQRMVEGFIESADEIPTQDDDGWYHYLVSLKIRTGEYEKSSKQLICAPNSSAAGDYAMYCESHDPDSLEWSSKHNCVADMGWQFAYSVISADLVNPSDLPALRKHFNVSRYDLSELQSCGNYPNNN